MTKRVICVPILMLAFASCDTIDEATPKVESTQNEPLSSLVTLADIRAADLFDDLRRLTVGEKVEDVLDLGELGLFSVVVERTSLVPDGFTADVVDAEGRVSTIALPARSLRVVSANGELSADLLVGPDRLAGVLHLGPEEYLLETVDDEGSTNTESRIGVFRAFPEGEAGASQDVACDDHDTSGMSPATRLAAPEQPSPGTARGGQCWKLEVRSHADYEFFVGVGKGDAHLAAWKVLQALLGGSKRYSVINLDFALPPNGGVTILTAPQSPFYFPTEHNSKYLVEQLRDFWNFFGPKISRDAVLLFSGKNLHYFGNYAALGRSYKHAVVCNQVENSYAVVEARAINTITYSIVAHEIGHLLAAEHTPTGLMMSSLGGPGELQFSQISRDEMNWHIWFNHGCMPMAACTQE